MRKIIILFTTILFVFMSCAQNINTDNSNPTEFITLNENKTSITIYTLALEDYYPKTYDYEGTYIRAFFKLSNIPEAIIETRYNYVLDLTSIQISVTVSSTQPSQKDYDKYKKFLYGESTDSKFCCGGFSSEFFDGYITTIDFGAKIKNVDYNYAGDGWISINIEFE